MKVSWIILTYNRIETVRTSVRTNKPFFDGEMIHVDNGSTDGTKEMLARHNPDIRVYHEQNLGVAKGYNHGVLMASGDYIAITGCDRIMPAHWLNKMRMVIGTIPNAGIVSIYSHPISKVPERLLQDRPVHPDLRAALPMEARLLSKELFHQIGYFREDFGLYGYEDIEWAHRAVKVCHAKGLECYVFQNEIAQHLGSEGNNDFDAKDGREYWEFKRAECKQEWKLKLLEQCKKRGYPYYNPYARKEDPIF